MYIEGQQSGNVNFPVLEAVRWLPTGAHQRTLVLSEDARIYVEHANEIVALLQEVSARGRTAL